MKHFFVQKSRAGRSLRQAWLQALLPSPVKTLFNMKEKELIPAPAAPQNAKTLSFHPAERKMARMNEVGPKP